MLFNRLAGLPLGVANDKPINSYFSDDSRCLWVAAVSLSALDSRGIAILDSVGEVPDGLAFSSFSSSSKVLTRMGDAEAPLAPASVMKGLLLLGDLWFLISEETEWMVRASPPKSVLLKSALRQLPLGLVSASSVCVI